MNAEIVRLGTMYVDGVPRNPGFAYQGESVSFGDTVDGYGLQWVRYGDLLIANRCVFTNTCWQQVNKLGFIYGAPVHINGKDYLCRSLKAGGTKDDPNEWNDALIDTDDCNELWHWGSVWTLLQEPKRPKGKTEVRGYYTSTGWYEVEAGVPYDAVGFRPVLEPMSPDMLLDGLVVGSNIKVYANGMSTVGKLKDFDDYDVLLSNPSEILNGCCVVLRHHKAIVISRAAITRIEPAQD